MSFIAELLAGKQIHDVLVDSEVTYIMLTDGTQITIHGLVVVEPSQALRSRDRWQEASALGGLVR